MFQDFLSHLEELRRRLIFCLVVFGLASAAAYFYSHPLLDFLTEPLRKYQNVQLIFQAPHEAFVIHLKAAMLAGLLASSPVVITQAWLFVSPGLYPKEKRILIPLILISVILFLSGAFFAYAYVIPWGLCFLLSFATEHLKPMLAVAPYFSFLSGMILAFGFFFDFPVVMIALVRLGILKTAVLDKIHRALIVLIFLAAAVLTPSPDPASQLLLAVPLVILFEVSLFIARAVEKKAFAEEKLPRV